MKYQDFLENKSHINTNNGFKAIDIPDFLYDMET